MRIFNRIVVTLLLAGLLVLGVYGVIYSFQIAGYSLSTLEQRLGIAAAASGAQSFLENLGQSALPASFRTACLAGRRPGVSSLKMRIRAIRATSALTTPAMILPVLERLESEKFPMALAALLAGGALGVGSGHGPVHHFAGWWPA